MATVSAENESYHVKVTCTLESFLSGGRDWRPSVYPQLLLPSRKEKLAWLRQNTSELSLEIRLHQFSGKRHRQILRSTPRIEVQSRDMAHTFHLIYIFL